jgi:hypothetical protein
MIGGPGKPSQYRKRMVASGDLRCLRSCGCNYRELVICSDVLYHYIRGFLPLAEASVQYFRPDSKRRAKNIWPNVRAIFWRCSDSDPPPPGLVVRSPHFHTEPPSPGKTELSVGCSMANPPSGVSGKMSYFFWLPTPPTRRFMV